MPPLLDIKSKVVYFTTPGAADLTPIVVTGVNDARTSVAFEPTVFIIQKCFDGFVNSGVSQFVSQSIGFDDGTVAMGQCRHSQWQFDALFMSAGAQNNFSVLESVDLFTQAYVTKGKVTSKASGTFTVTLTTNTFGSSRFAVLCLGGADADFKILTDPLNSVTTVITGVGFAVKGLACINMGGNFGVGDNLVNVASMGFCGTDLAQISGVSLPQFLSDPVDAFKYQRTGKFAVGLDPQTETSPFSVEVTVLGTDGFTLVRTGSLSGGLIMLAIGGPDVYVGSVLEPIADGNAIVTIPGIKPQVLLLESVGAAASDLIQTDSAFSFGMSDGINSASAWYSYLDGSSHAGNAGQAWGGSKGMFFAAPNGPDSSSSILTGQATVSTNVNGFRLPFTDTDGLQREIGYLAFGSAIDVEPLSGIYKLTPGKRNDTLYLTYSPVTTEDVKIP